MRATAEPMPTIGRKCCCACTPSGLRKMTTRSSCWIARTTKWRESKRHDRHPRPNGLWLFQGRNGYPSPGAHQPVQCGRQAQTSFAAIDVSPEINDRHLELKLTTRRSRGCFPGQRCRRATCQQNRQRDPTDAHANRISSCSARTSAANTRIAPPPGKCSCCAARPAGGRKT